jgi:dephospho-CoA kinase
MIKIGLVGGIASGKSLVAGLLVDLGAGLLDADRAGHEVLRQTDVIAEVRARWGDKVISGDGQVDRAAVGRIVFGESETAVRERRYLEQITHPRIARLLDRRMNAYAAEGKPAVVLDIPLILESGWKDWCDKIVFVDAPREVRLARARQRGWSDAEFDAREAAQETLDVKRRQADVIIDNSGSQEFTLAQTERFWHSLVG